MGGKRQHKFCNVKIATEVQSRWPGIPTVQMLFRKKMPSLKSYRSSTRLSVFSTMPATISSTARERATPNVAFCLPLTLVCYECKVMLHSIFCRMKKGSMWRLWERYTLEERTAWVPSSWFTLNISAFTEKTTSQRRLVIYHKNRQINILVGGSLFRMLLLV